MTSWSADFKPRVNREVLCIEVSLWQLQRWEKTDSYLSCTKQKLAGLKTRGLVGLWATFEESFFYVLGGKKKFKFFKKYIVASALDSCIKWS